MVYNRLVLREAPKKDAPEMFATRQSGAWAEATWPSQGTRRLQQRDDRKQLKKMKQTVLS